MRSGRPRDLWIHVRTSAFCDGLWPRYVNLIVVHSCGVEMAICRQVLHTCVKTNGPSFASKLSSISGNRWCCDPLGQCLKISAHISGYTRLAGVKNAWCVTTNPSSTWHSASNCAKTFLTCQISSFSFFTSIRAPSMALWIQRPCSWVGIAFEPIKCGMGEGGTQVVPVKAVLQWLQIEVWGPVLENLSRAESRM